MQDIQIFIRTSQSTRQLINSYLLTIKKNFSREASKCRKGIPYYSKNICKYLQEYLILPEGPDFVLSRTPQFSRQKHTSEHLFYRTASNGCFQISTIFFKWEKPKKIFIAPEAVILRCSVKKVFLKVSQNSQENTCAGVSFLIKLQA